MLALWTLSAVSAASATPVVAEAAALRFRETAAAWGLSFRHHHAGSGRYYMVETMGAGVAIFDYDQDGDPDVFYVDGAQLPGYQGEAPRARLLRNDRGEGGVQFTDVTADAGLTLTVYGMGAVAADIDGDGDLDLYVTGFGANQMFENLGDGRFRDITARARTGVAAFSASAAFADLDRDGDLDLYVTNYVDFDFDHNPICGNQEKGVRAYCHPDVYHGVPDVFFRNRGDGTFDDDTQRAGFDLADGTGLGVIVGDVDADGWPDVYVANDMRANNLFRNRGDGRFEEVGLLAGVAFNDRGDPEASMGVAMGDLDGDGRPEIAATHLDAQTNALYSYLGGWLFVDKRYSSKLAEPSIGKVGFGIAFLDLDQDGWLDLAVANGHIIDNIEKILPQFAFRQPNQVFRNRGGGVFEPQQHAGLRVVRASRGLAAGDLDGDLDLDLVISNSNDLSEVYENRTEGGHALAVDLRQHTGNRLAVGARLEARFGAEHGWRETRAGDSYLSESSLTAHFGLGQATKVDALRVIWPGDGAITEIRGLPADVRLRVVRQTGPTIANPQAAGSQAAGRNRQRVRRERVP